MTKLILAGIIGSVLFTPPAFAKFSSDVWFDEMNDTKVSSITTASTSGYFENKFGFECRMKESESEGSLRLIFASKEHIATPNSKVDITYRVDKGAKYEIEGSTYSNDYKSGLVYTFTDALLSDLMSGNVLHVELRKYGSLKDSQKFSLTGSTEAVRKIMSICGKSINSSKNEKVKAIQAKYKSELRRITKQRDSALAELNK